MKTVEAGCANIARGLSGPPTHAIQSSKTGHAGNYNESVSFFPKAGTWGLTWCERMHGCGNKGLGIVLQASVVLSKQPLPRFFPLLSFFFPISGSSSEATKTINKYGMMIRGL